MDKKQLDPYKPRNDEIILVIGASGYVGKSICTQFANRKRKWKVYGTYSSNKIDSIPVEEWYKVDLSDDSIIECIKKVQPKVIINTSVFGLPHSEKDEEKAMKVNIPTKIIENMPYNNTYLIHFSTAMVYEGGETPFKETDPTNPNTVYAKSKLESEKYVLENWSKSTVLRLGQVYGPDVDGERKSFFQWILKELEERIKNPKLPKLELFDDEQRDFIAMNDIVDVIELLITRHRSNNTKGEMLGLFNLSGMEKSSKYLVAKKICELKGWNENDLISPVSQKSGTYTRPKLLFSDSSKLRSVFPQKQWTNVDTYLPFLLNSFDKNYYFKNSPHSIIRDYLKENDIEGTILFACPSYSHLWNVATEEDKPSFYGVVVFPSSKWMKVKRPKFLEMTIRNYTKGNKPIIPVLIEIDEISKVMEEIIKSGPQVLEYLFVEETTDEKNVPPHLQVYCHPLWNKLRSMRDSFFNDYAKQQFFVLPHMKIKSLGKVFVDFPPENILKFLYSAESINKHNQAPLVRLQDNSDKKKSPPSNSKRGIKNERSR